ncbi:MAG: phosphatidylserine decarboxylase family protein [Candidatus Firestonebacteria bacterium]
MEQKATEERLNFIWLFALGAIFITVGFLSESTSPFVIGSVFLVLFAFVVFFFRDPDRKITEAPNAILSPADGKIVAIVSEEEKEFIKTLTTRVSIFLSPLNVHVQRAPCNCKTVWVKYSPGKFLPAFREKASVLNEQNLIALENDKTKILIKQIAGIVARRVVCWVKKDEKVKSGERIGFIKFGSRVDIFLPNTAKLNVKNGESVQAGITVLALL